MSGSFTGATTRSFEEVDREIESRIAGRKGREYQAPHDDKRPVADPSFTLSAAGPDKNPSMRDLDNIDRQVQKHDGAIKPPSEQFPMKKPAGDVSGFDPNQTDPARLRAEIRKDLGAEAVADPISGIQSARDHYMKSLKRLMSAGDPVKGTTTVAVMCAGHLLMGKRRDNGKWTLPGGGMNPGEAPIAGALRELREEAGIVAGSLQPLASEVVAGRSGRKVEVHCFRADFAARPTTRTAQDPDEEVANWEWIDISGGLPATIAQHLQSPRNLLLQKLGLQK